MEKISNLEMLVCSSKGRKWTLIIAFLILNALKMLFATGRYCKVSIILQVIMQLE